MKNPEKIKNSSTRIFESRAEPKSRIGFNIVKKESIAAHRFPDFRDLRKILRTVVKGFKALDAWPLHHAAIYYMV
jgi:hypothetical protein